jgi:hypothetical protein
MLRPRRPRSSSSLRSSSVRSSTSSLHHHDSCHDIQWNCPPGSIYIDDSSSSSCSDSEFEEDISYIAAATITPPKKQPISVELTMNDKHILPLCRVSNSRDKVMAQRTYLVRTIMTIFAIAAVAISFISSNNNHSIGSSHIHISNDITLSKPDIISAQVRKRRLIEVAIPKLPKVLGRATIAEEARIRHDMMNRLIHEFGTGPHMVEFQIRVWDNDDIYSTKSWTYYFTIEMAPVHMMPASIYMFLQQVSKGLWDNTSFYLNMDHIFAAHPISGNGVISKQNLLLQSGLEKLPYKEYNSAYPHAPYTLGFVRNGPEFYINKHLNTHQDPCFGNVVIGRSTIDTLFRLRKKNDRTPKLLRPVDIVSAKIIQRNNLHPNALDEYKQNTRQKQ